MGSRTPTTTRALPRSSDGLFKGPREARWKTEPLRVRDAAGSQGFKSLTLHAYGLTSPLLSHSTSSTKEEEEGRTWNANHGIPCVSAAGRGFKRKRTQVKLLLRV